MKRKGQAAMEFLMTYGWAILAAIIVIGVLAIYFRPSSLTTTQVIVTAPFYGVGAVVGSASQVQIEVRNNGGETLTLDLTDAGMPTDIVGAGCTAVQSPLGPDPIVAHPINAGASVVLTFTGCTLGSGGDTVNRDVVLSYQRGSSLGAGSLTLTSTGTLSGRVPST